MLVTKLQEINDRTRVGGCRNDKIGGTYMAGCR